MLRDNLLRILIFTVGFGVAQLTQQRMHEGLRAVPAPSVELTAEAR